MNFFVQFQDIIINEEGISNPFSVVNSGGYSVFSKKRLRETGSYIDSLVDYGGMSVAERYLNKKRYKIIGYPSRAFLDFVKERHSMNDKVTVITNKDVKLAEKCFLRMDVDVISIDNLLTYKKTIPINSIVIVNDTEKIEDLFVFRINPRLSDHEFYNQFSNNNNARDNNNAREIHFPDLSYINRVDIEINDSTRFK